LCAKRRERRGCEYVHGMSERRGMAWKNEDLNV
jgi:hypothetical protein